MLALVAAIAGPQQALEVDQRVLDAALDRDPAGQRGGARARRAPSTPGEVQPHSRALAQREQQAGEADRQRRGALVVRLRRAS